MAKIPPHDVLMTKPDPCRTIYVWRPSTADARAFAMTLEPRITSAARSAAGFRLMDANNLIELPGQPKRLYVYRHPDVRARGDLYASIKLSTTDLVRPLPAAFQVFGEPVIRDDLRAIIEACDPDGGHQFMPCMIYGPNGETVAEQPYFHFVCGRCVLTSGDPEIGFDVLRTDIDPMQVTPQMGDHATALFLATLPVWNTMGGSARLYFSETVFAKIREQGLEGFKEYSQFRGKKPDDLSEVPETVGHVWIAEQA